MPTPTLAELNEHGYAVPSANLTEWVILFTALEAGDWMLESARVIFGKEVITLFHNGDVGKQLGGGMHIGYNTKDGGFVVLSTNAPEWFVPNPNKLEEMSLGDLVEWEKELTNTPAEAKEGKVVNGYNIVPPNPRSLLHVHTPEPTDDEK